MRRSGELVAALFSAELRMLLRDRRTIFTSFVLPLFTLPLVLYASHYAEAGRETRLAVRTYTYTVEGSEAAAARAWLAAWQGEEETEAPENAFAEVVPADPEAALEVAEIDARVEALSTVEALDAKGDTEADEEAVPLVRITFRGDRDASNHAATTLERRFEAVRDAEQAAALRVRGFPIDPAAVMAVDVQDVAAPSAVSGAALGRFATVFVLLFLLTGGSVVAADTLAGEKERGTLETLLTTAISRGEIVFAKQLLVLAVGMAIALVQVLSLLICVGLELIPLPTSLAVELSWPAVLVLLAFFLPLAALVSSTLLWVSGYAESYKAFQQRFFPIFLLFLLPACAAFLPGVTLRSAIVAVPVANVSVAVREVLTGTFDLPMLALAWLLTLGVAALVMRATTRALMTERLVSGADLDQASYEGGAALFPRHVLRWYLAMWVLLFLASGSLTSLRGQLVFNLVGVFLGGALLLVWRYQLGWRRSLALRPVRPWVWLAVMVGAPASLVTGIALGKLSFFLFPLPESTLEAFAELLLPADMPLWQLLLYVAVLPAICEEVSFRGVLLHGLRRRFHPVVLCLVVGGIFGLFHFTLARFLSTAYLGALLAALTLLTASLLPAILWHALNNATALLAERAGLDLLTLGPATYAAGTLVSLCVFALLWRRRTPYPGLLGSVSRR